MYQEFDYTPEDNYYEDKYKEKVDRSPAIEVIKKFVGEKYRSLDKVPVRFLWLFFGSGEFKTGDMIADENGKVWTFLNTEDGIILNSADKAFMVSASLE
tara:strand:+ start:1763 stop:2059 length:297 start_codon:yes stop_codon:yes gene_type:complete